MASPEIYSSAGSIFGDVSPRIGTLYTYLFVRGVHLGLLYDSNRTTTVVHGSTQSMSAGMMAIYLMYPRAPNGTGTFAPSSSLCPGRNKTSP